MKERIKKLIVHKSENGFIQFFRYNFVGFATFLVDYVLFIGLVNGLHLHHMYANILSLPVALTVNYFLTVLWVFTVRKHESRFVEITLFVIISIIAVFLNTFTLWLFADILHLHALLAKPCANILTSLYNFFARKYVLFR